MPVELSYLSASVILLAAMILVQGLSGILQYGLVAQAGARDGQPEPNLFLSRAKRAAQNMIEALAIFAPLVLIAIAADRTNETTALGATIFFWSRVAYAPCYWLGLPWIRTLVWAGGLIGTVMVLLQVLPFH